MTTNRLSTYSRKALYDLKLHFYDDSIDDQTYCVVSEKMSVVCYWRGQTIHVFNLASGAPLISWTFYRRIESPCVLRCVELLMIGSKPHVVCSLSLLEDSASLIYLVDIIGGTLTRVIRIPHEITSLTLITGPHEKIDSPVVGYFFGCLALGCRAGYTYLIDLALDEKIRSSEEHPLTMEIMKVENDSTTSRARRTAAGKQMLIAVCLDESVVSWGKYRHKKTNGDLWVALDATDVHVTCLTFLRRLGLMAIGFSFGCIQLWNMRRLLPEYSMAYDRSRGPVFSITYQEPEDDPKNFVYLWIGRQCVEDSAPSVVSLLQLGFSRSHRSSSSHSKSERNANSRRFVHPVYERLTAASVRFQQPLRTGSISVDSERVSSCLMQSSCIPMVRPPSGGTKVSSDVSMCLIAFVWREGRRHLLSLFDLDRWYHAQMPTVVPATGHRRPGVPQAVWDLCPFFCTYELTGDSFSGSKILHGTLLEKSVMRWRHHVVMEQNFYPSALNFEVLTCTERGVTQHIVLSMQDLLIRNMMSWAADLASPAHREGNLTAEARDLLSRCLVCGFITRDELSPGATGPSAFPVRLLLDVYLDQGLHSALIDLLTQCLPGGQLAAHGFTHSELVEWLWHRVETSKQRLDNLSHQLYDLSGVALDSFQRMDLTAVLRRLTSAERVFAEAIGKVEAMGGEGRGRIVGGLHVRWSAVTHVVMYAKAVEWMVRHELLPEQEEGVGGCVMENIRRDWEEKRQDSKWTPLVDGLVELSGGRGLRRMWLEYEAGGETDPGCVFYPPPSMQALLSSLLLIEDDDKGALIYKHCLLIYFILDFTAKSGNTDASDSNMDESELNRKQTKPSKVAPLELWEDYAVVFSLPRPVVLTVVMLWNIDHGIWEDVGRLMCSQGITRRATFPRQHISVLEKLRGEEQHVLAQRYFDLYVAGGRVNPVDGQEALLYVQVQLCPLSFQRISSIVTFIRHFKDHLPDVAELAWREICQTCLKTGQMVRLFDLPLREQEEGWVENFLIDWKQEELLTLYYLQRRDVVSALKMKKRAGSLCEEKVSGVQLLTELHLKSLPTLHRRLLEQPNSAWVQPMSTREVEPKLMPMSLVMARHKDKIGLSSSTTLLRSVVSHLETMRALDRELYEEGEHAGKFGSSNLLMSAQKAAQKMDTDLKRKLQHSLSSSVIVPTPIKQRILSADSPHVAFTPIITPAKSPRPRLQHLVNKKLPEFAQEVLRTPPVQRRKEMSARKKTPLPRPASILKSDSNASHRSGTPSREEVRFSGRLIAPRHSEVKRAAEKATIEESNSKMDLDTSFTAPFIYSSKSSPAHVSKRTEFVETVSYDVNCGESPEEKQEVKAENSMEVEKESSPEVEVSSLPLITKRLEEPQKEPFSFSPPRTRQTGGHLAAAGDYRPISHYLFSPPILPPSKASKDAQEIVADDRFNFSPPRVPTSEKPAGQDTWKSAGKFTFSPPTRPHTTASPSSHSVVADDTFNFSPPRVTTNEQPVEQSGWKSGGKFIFSPPVTRSARKKGLTREQHKLKQLEAEQRAEEAESRRKEDEERKEAERRRKVELERVKREAERRRKEEEDRERREAEKRKKKEEREAEETEKRRKEEEERRKKEAEKRKREEEERRKKEAEKRKREEQEQRKIEAEKRKKEEEERQRKEAEKQKKMELEKEKREAEKRRKEEQERERKEAEKKKKEKEMKEAERKKEDSDKKEAIETRRRTRKQKEETVATAEIVPQRVLRSRAVKK